MGGLPKRTIPFHCLGNGVETPDLEIVHVFNGLQKFTAHIGQKLLFGVTAGWEKLFSFSRNPVLYRGAWLHGRGG
jgi:hypothetical protein